MLIGGDVYYPTSSSILYHDHDQILSLTYLIDTFEYLLTVIGANTRGTTYLAGADISTAKLCTVNGGEHYAITLVK